MYDRITVNGRWYVAEDTLTGIGPPDEGPMVLLKPLCKEYGVDPHKAYAAARAGALDARLPAGSKRGLRVRRSEFRRWYEEELMGRCA